MGTAIILPSHDENGAVHDPLLPWLQSAKKALDEWYSGKDSGATDLYKLLSNCINTFKHHSQYKNDIRFLKIWFLYLEGSKDYEKVFREMEELGICTGHSFLYQWYAIFLELNENWRDAHMVYQIGISRKAEPLDKLEEALALFIDRLSERLQKIDDGEIIDSVENYIHPWSSSTMNKLLKQINSQIMKFEGYHRSNKVYSGKVALSSLNNSSRNKTIEIGGKKYQIKGCAGQGGFAKVFKAYVNGDPEDVVALKIQKPAFPWEFYMYRQLDQRISGRERSSFGFAHRIHLYSDYSILVCDYLSQGTLQDAINSYVVIGKSMEEVLCIYYTIEMLCILESLHDVGIIHGDFKPDNLLIRYARDELTVLDHDRSGPWQDQGLCLVDWGRGIDLHLFPDNMEFEGDCRTSGFRCIEMQEKKPWKFQVDTYGLCAIVHMMLHNSYMEIEKKASPDGGLVYLPKLSFKRYWKVELWKSLFTNLLNMSSGNDKEVLQNLQKSFQDYLCSNPQLLKNLKELLAKQRASLCGA
ncbi:mitotic checkpoint serine/threonine-protein kinase BUB1 [Citrus sinensis]|uniref:Mitotic checkpoint serine/threonine-protein kinase BUB1 n=1 Tax=Citrus sinensis TaxID=2711 RepID=A0ACB8N413_CITSI|nr:mitotic checkpoint serine/threonine-protein kinase BUB1 [Citrus sinensis]